MTKHPPEEKQSMDEVQNSEGTQPQDEALLPDSTPEELLAQLQQQYSDLEHKHAEVADAYLRAKAETENTRRRAVEDESKARKFAIESFAENLLPVRDSLEAALNTPNQTYESLKEGVETTLKQLTAAFERNKIIEVAPVVGDKFDPNVHQAISVVPAEQEPNTIVETLQKGYTIAERTLRPAMVIVAAKK
ncbi:Protein GrpE [Saezia sanguinis]|uniref:Protein GrpE n=1 Tax=Saezia sanguinis TaxID=1965230 RepID=A0A433SHL4_9BURK|nr:nucleotide exchange factor GrpE [Saezia sanguinis]RUS68180.1 Protein GrpE [Saezia sanguinis]